MKVLLWETKRVRLGDDLELTYETLGAGLPVLLLNGLGGSREIWEELVEFGRDRYRFIAFDYRGLRTRSTNGFAPPSIEQHARDVQAIFDAEDISRCAVVGWSMGVSVALELFAQAPNRVASLALLCGSARVAWSQSTLRTLPVLVLLRALHLARRRPEASQRLLRMGLQLPEAFTWARRLGLMGDQITSDAYARLTDSLLGFDLSSYVTTLDGFTQYDGSAVLSQVDVPTLVIGGGRDPFTVRSGLEELAQNIHGAEYLLLPEGTHYLLLDQAEWVNLRIAKFWNERGYAAP